MTELAGRKKTTTKFSKIRRPETPERRAAIDAIKDAMSEGERLYELRKGRGVTQVDLAETMDVTQGSVSTLERREDLFVSTLRHYVEGLGGRLMIAAVFEDDELHPIEVGMETSIPDGGTVRRA